MKKSEEWIVYQKALFDFRVDDFLNSFHINLRRTYVGFCYYFRHQHNLHLVDDLPTLYSLKPNNMPFSPFWFHYSDRKSRIGLLKEAIKSLENQAREEQKTTEYYGVI